MEQYCLPIVGAMLMVMMARRDEEERKGARRGRDIMREDVVVLEKSRLTNDTLKIDGVLLPNHILELAPQPRIDQSEGLSGNQQSCDPINKLR